MTSPWAAGDERRPRASLLASAATAFGTNLGAAALGLLNVLIISRALGPSGRGQVVFLMTMAMLISQLATLGVETANGRIGAADARARPSLATNSVILAVLLGTAGTAAVIAVIAAVPAVGSGADAADRWLALAAPPLLILAHYLWVLVQSDYRFAVTNVVWLLGPVTNVVANGVLVAVGALTVRTALAAWVAGQALGLVVLVWYVARRFSGFGRPSAALARRALSFGLKAHAGQIAMVGNFRLDQWLLGAMVGAHALGLYSVAVAWAEVLFFLPTVLVIVQRPDLVRATAAEAARQAAAAFRAAAVITIGLAAATAAAAPFLCVTVFGEEFRGSVADVRVLAFGALGVVALKQLGSALTCQGKPMRETAAIAVALVTTVVLDVLLIPRYADFGAAIASALAYTAGGATVTVLFASALGARPATLVPRRAELRSLWRRARLAARRPTPVEER